METKMWHGKRAVYRNLAYEDAADDYDLVRIFREGEEVGVASCKPLDEVIYVGSLATAEPGHLRRLIREIWDRYQLPIVLVPIHSAVAAYKAVGFVCQDEMADVDTYVWCPKV